MSSDSITLLTGASGFIGGHLARLLYEQGRSLRLLLRRGASTSHLKGIQFEPVYGDLRDYPSIVSAMKGVEVVYHAAALFALWARRKEDFFEINVLGTKNICQAALEAKVKKFVYTSTTGAVGISMDPKKPLDEDSSWNRGWTKDPYTISKYEAEQVVKSYVKLKLPAVILNPTGPIGPGDVRPTPTGQMICDFVSGHLPFYVDAHFSLVDVRDVAMGHYLAEQKGRIGERYILSGINLSAKELLEKIAVTAGKPAPRLQVPQPVIRAFAGMAEFFSNYITHMPPLITRAYAKLLPYYFWFDASKSVKELGLKYHSIDTAIQDAIAWFKAEGRV